jgi:hypothetical protein
MPQEGFGFYSDSAYGIDIDTIQEHEWEPCRFSRVADHQPVFVGDTIIDNVAAYVWWSLVAGCFLAQQIPRDHLKDAFIF